MINVAAKPFRMMASGKSESGIDCMFCRAMEIGLLGSRITYALKEPYLLVYTNMGIGHEHRFSNHKRL